MVTDTTRDFLSDFAEMSSFGAGTLRRMEPCSLASFWMVTPSRERDAVLGASWMLKGNA